MAAIDITAPLEQWLPVRWYGSYMPGLPDLCVGRWPASLGRTGAGAWKMWVAETPAEALALRAALALPVPRAPGGALDFRAGPDAAVARPGRIGPVVALYAPPEIGWPWVTLVATPGAAGLYRQCYAYDVDTTESAALDRVARLAAHHPRILVRTPEHQTS